MWPSFIAFGDVLIFGGGIAVGVLFKDKFVWVKNRAVEFYNLITGNGK